MFNRCRSPGSLERGQGLVEYALILVLVAVVAVAILTLLGDQIQIQNKAINQLQNEVDWIKETLRRRKEGVGQNEKVHTIDTEPISSISRSQENKLPTLIKEKTSEKEELLEALKIIDDL